MREWTTWAPVVALLALLFTWQLDPGTVIGLILAVLLGAAVLAAVHHAEVIAHRVGEPFGSLVLAVAVTVIEVGLIVTLMSSGAKDSATLARDTVFAAVMITLNGIVGLSVAVDAGRSGWARFNMEGSGSALSAVSAVAVLCLVLPNFTSAPGPTFSAPQLVFAAIVSSALYFLFVMTQTRTHRDYFLPVGEDGKTVDDADHTESASNRATMVSLALLLISLVAIVGLAKTESPAVTRIVAALGLHPGFVGVVIALLVLGPETLAAVRAARRGRVQTSFNLAYGSAMASIGLTIPTMAILSLFLSTPLHLGLANVQILLLALSIVASILTLGGSRANRLQAGVHLVLLATFVFLAAAP